MEDPLAVAKFSWDLARRINRDGVSCREQIVLLCIGTDRSTGDCLGPLIGTKLNSCQQEYFKIYGTLDQPAHASNLNEKLEEIKREHENPYIIALDACLGSMDNVGCVNIGDGALQPGSGVNKSLPPVGDLHITGVVNVGGYLEYMVLQNTRLNIVMKMADLIVEGLLRTVSQYSQLETRGF
ncbi:spore protease YyaC [Desulfocucumis palustris]|nr:spore protease YyaC [Desulfocucumis palustris]